MKICLYYKPINKPWGGTNTFILQLKKFFIDNGIEITHDIDSNYNVLFLNSAYKAPGKYFSYRKISKVKRKWFNSLLWRKISKKRNRQLNILYRLDGLRKVYADIESKMDDIQFRCINLADHIVFQSNFAHQLFKESGYMRDNFSIVSNGVDQRLFNMNGRSYWDNKSKLMIISCSWSSNPAKGHKTISDVSCLDDVEVHFIGNWAEDISPKNVKRLGQQNQEKIAELFKQFHIFLFPSINEACSNNLLEALSCGLPVLYVDSGSNKEIAGKYGVKINYSNIGESLEKIKKRYNSLIENINIDSKRFSIEYSGKQYLDICNSF